MQSELSKEEMVYKELVDTHKRVLAALMQCIDIDPKELGKSEHFYMDANHLKGRPSRLELLEARKQDNEE